MITCCTGLCFIVLCCIVAFLFVLYIIEKKCIAAPFQTEIAYKGHFGLLNFVKVIQMLDSKLKY